MRFHRNVLLLALPVTGCAISAATNRSSQDETASAPPDASTQDAEVEAASDAGTPALSCTPDASPSFTNVVLSVFHESCGAAEFCHGFTWSSKQTAKSFLFQTSTCPDERPIVTPSDPGRSYLVNKLTNTNLCSGKPMPKPFGGPWTPIAAEDMQTVYDWICAGAIVDDP